MKEYLLSLAHYWISHKSWLAANIGLSDDALHVYFALAILFGSAVVLRRRPDSIWCWLIVLLFELFNEYADIGGNAPGEATINAGLHDIYNTMFWPTMLLLFGRFLFPRRLETNSDSPPNLTEESSSP